MIEELTLALRNSAKDISSKTIDWSIKAEDAARDFVTHPITIKLAKIKIAELAVLAGAYAAFPDETKWFAYCAERFVEHNSAPIALYASSMTREIRLTWRSLPWLHYIL